MTFREFMKENGYELQTTFWNDFTIADHFGLAGIQKPSTVRLKNGKIIVSISRS